MLALPVYKDSSCIWLVSWKFYGHVFHFIAVGLTLSPFKVLYSIQYIIHHVLPKPGNPLNLTFLVYGSCNDKHLHESISYIHVVIASFCSSDISLDWMVSLVNYLMWYYCKVLDWYSTSGSSLGDTLHKLISTPISSITESIMFDLITILYYKIYYSIDAISDDIWTRGI